jgi:hypothetical protein
MNTIKETIESVIMLLDGPIYDALDMDEAREDLEENAIDKLKHVLELLNKLEEIPSKKRKIVL